MSKISNFLKDENGATAIEYGLIAALIGVAIVTGATALGDAVNAKFEGTAEILDEAGTDD